MACYPMDHDAGHLRLVPAAASTTVTKGNMMIDNGAGYIANVTAGEGVTPQWVAAETITTGAAVGDLVLCISTRGPRFVCDVDAAPVQTDVGTYADIAAAGTIDPDASADDVFFIEKIRGTSGLLQRVEGWFAHGTANS